MRGRLHGVRCDPHIAIGAVLEADRAGQARGQLAMDLALGRACADRGPGHEVGDVLRRRHVEEFRAGGQAEIVHGRQHVARQPQALVDVEAAVQIGIVDQALPTDGGARLLEIDPHYDFELVGEFLAQAREPLGIFERGLGVMHRAGADHDQQAVVLAIEDCVDGVTRSHHHARRGERPRDFAHHLIRRAQLFQFADTKIVGRAQHGGLLFVSNLPANKKAARSGGLFGRLLQFSD
ncbi:hypothetical protein BROWWM01_52420 [Bradyrhizobium ottawaense]